MKTYRSLAALVLLLVLAHTRVPIAAGWTVPAIPLVLVTATVIMLALMFGVIRAHQQPRRAAPRRQRYAPAGG